MNQDKKLIAANQSSLLELLGLIDLVGSENYTACAKPGFESTIGQHVRHVVEHYQCFFTQLPNGMICYDERARMAQLELDSRLARHTIETELIAMLDNTYELAPSSGIKVCDMQAQGSVSSSVERELVFLQSHTTHHNAMIAAMARFLGFKPNVDTGVAAATREYKERFRCAQ
jgi:uncharacterized damage-inducible protein DinB